MTAPDRESPSHEELVSVMQTASHESRTAIRELRTMIMEIAPPDLDQGGISAALERLATVAREHGMTADVDLAISAEGQPLDDVALIFRTAQEAIRNVVKHADAKHVSIRLSRSQGMVTLVITDDGCGFTPEDLKRRRQNGHVGLSLLEERVVEAGATIEVHSAPGHGTSVRLQLARS
jgi:two-component system NarL family sensor kinase